MGKTYKQRLRDLQRYHLRDRETKKVIKMFRSLPSVWSYRIDMRFNLGVYYEIYDSYEKRVIEHYG